MKDKMKNKIDLEKAAQRGINKLKRDTGIVGTTTSAGFLLNGPMGNRHGFQIFVRVCVYSDELLKRDKRSGGLLCPP